MWAYDFVFDACANGQQLKCLAVIDESTREALAIDVAGSTRVIEILAKLISVHGAPKYLRFDNGAEFLSRAILRWLAHQNIETALIDPASPGRTAPTSPSTASFATSACRWSGFASSRCEDRDRKLAQALQRGQAAFQLGQLTPVQFKQQLSTTTRNQVRRKPQVRCL